jgi:Na+/H+-dicarboxylate symporter
MFMSLNPILDMIDTPAACLGNLAVTLVASRNENMLDLEKFYGHE